MNEVQNAIVNQVFQRWAVNFTYGGFAFVFFYFGLQKPAPVDSPVRTPVAVFADELSTLLSTLLGTSVTLSLEWTLLVIGTYEMFLGLLFLFKRIRLAFWLFLVHQAVGFISLLLIWPSVFQPPWFSVAGINVPWALGTYAAFVLKNLLFIAAFAWLAIVELGDGKMETD